MTKIPLIIKNSTKNGMQVKDIEGIKLLILRVESRQDGKRCFFLTKFKLWLCLVHTKIGSLVEIGTMLRKVWKFMCVEKF